MAKHLHVARPIAAGAAVKPAPTPVAPAPPRTRYGLIPLAETGEIKGTGWKRDVPDMRDFTEEREEISTMAIKLGITKVKNLAGPLTERIEPIIDLRPFCSEIADQGELGSCTANAGVGVLEYFENRAFAKHLDASRLFVYKTTRDLMGLEGDSGAEIRSTMGALVMFGAPPEKYWPYTTATEGDLTFDTEPSPFVFQLAHNFEATKYFCHDPFGRTHDPKLITDSVKTYLAHGIPAIFGFYVFPSYTKGDVPGSFPFPGKGEKAVGGHAVVAVGYNDNLKITNTSSNQSTTGALLIRNSWGTSWGEDGYGWLPYDYITAQLAEDFWSLLDMKWVDTGEFGLD